MRVRVELTPITNTMSRLNRERNISRLDGFLSGISAFSGDPRDYTSFSYFIDYKKEASSIEQVIKEFYSWQPDLEFSAPEPLAGGLRELEIAIRPFLVRDGPHVNAGKLIDLRRYLSFKVMEQISSALDTDSAIEVIKLSSAPKPLSSDVIYFCIRMEGCLIILQFNNNIEFKKSPCLPPS